MPMAAAMATVLRFALTDIMGTLRMRVLLTGTMARHGLAVDSLSGPVPGIGATMAIAASTAEAMDMVMAVAMDTDEATAMAVAATADIAVATVAGFMAVAAGSMVAGSMAVAVTAAADTDNSVR